MNIVSELAASSRIVLVRTSHPGNIGAAARAMKTMGFSQLSLVKPKYFPDPEATARATHAADILDAADVCDTLPDALSEAVIVYGLSARHRDLSAHTISLESAAQEALTHRKDGLIAWVFGNETTGLTNDELKWCHRLVHIPTDAECASLNLGSAVQVVTYALRMAALTEVSDLTEETSREPLANFREYEGLYEHLERVLWKTEFLESGNDERLMRRLRRLFDRALLEKREAVILRGILTSIERAITLKQP